MKYLIIVFILIAACTPLKEYQKSMVRSEQMRLDNNPLDSFESDFESYREGAVGGNNGNRGSGCGCN